MLDQPANPDHSDGVAAPKPKRTWPLRGAARGRLKAGRKTTALLPGGTLTNTEIVERLAGLASTADEACCFFRVSQPTWNSRLKRYPALKAAWARGQTLLELSVKRILFRNAERNTASGARAAIFLAQRILDWSGDSGFIEKPEPVAPGGVPAEALERLTVKEREQLEEIMRKLSPEPSP